MLETITKNDIAKEIANKNGISKTLSYRIICDMFNLILDKIVSGKRIEIRNFGIFTKKDMKEREGRNPQNGRPILIKAKSTIKFKPSKTISEAME